MQLHQPTNYSRVSSYILEKYLLVLELLSVREVVLYGIMPTVYDDRQLVLMHIGSRDTIASFRTTMNRNEPFIHFIDWLIPVLTSVSRCDTACSVECKKASWIPRLALSLISLWSDHTTIQRLMLLQDHATEQTSPRTTYDVHRLVAAQQKRQYEYRHCLNDVTAPRKAIFNIQCCIRGHGCRQ